MRLLIAVLALLLIGCEFPRCHTGHYEVSYHPAYTTTHSSCSSRDKDGNCTSRTYYTVNHPHRCDVSFECDVLCKSLDAGKIEAHIPHEPRRNYALSTCDRRCWWNRQMEAYPK